MKAALAERLFGKSCIGGEQEQAPSDCPGPAIPLPRVAVPLVTGELARAQTAILESASQTRTGRDSSGRASQPAPCRRGRYGVRAEPSSRTGIPLLRLPLGSKGGEVLEFAVAHHDGPSLNLPDHSARAGECRRNRRFSLAGDGRRRPIWPPAESDRRQPFDPMEHAPSFTSTVRSGSKHRDFRNCRLCAPGQLRRPHFT